MDAIFNFPWHQYAVIAELAKRLESRSPQFGKTALQKMIYLLQTLFHVDCGYTYTLYHYGPYAADLLTDLDYVQALGGIKIEDVERGIRILPGDKIQELSSRASGFLENASDGIDKVVENFGSYMAKELELFATIIYADREVQKDGRIYSHQEFIGLIQGIKPGFSYVEIERSVDELKNKRYIESRS